MKRVFTLLLCAALLVPAAAAEVWYREALDWGRDQGVSGAPLERPEEALTRGETVRLLWEAAGSPSAGLCPFADVAPEDAQAAAWAAAEGIVQGVGGGSFAPDRPVTRQEFAAILHRQAGETDVPAQGLKDWRDAGAVAPWARAAVLWAVSAGVLVGDETGALRPGDGVTGGEALTMVRRAAALPDVSGLAADLGALTAAPRPLGSAGEAAAADYLAERFAQLGYAVTRQPYTDEDGNTGTNVIAVKAAARADADILVLSAHHDSVPNAWGADDNASGTAALLYLAEALEDMAGDTELRFISFTGEENGKLGSRYYASTLTDGERERMIGDIQLDMLGGLGTDGAMVCTVDGEANWLSDLLQTKNPALPLQAESASDHAAFQLAGVPAVMVSQNGRGYLYHTAGDTADRLDLYAIAAAAETVLAAVEEIADPDTASFRSTAREQGDGYVYRQRRQNVIYFGSSLADSEAYIGAAGELTDTQTVSGQGWSDTYETYRYAMGWFDAEAPMNTYYLYRNGYLENIEIRPAETGYAAGEVRELIEAMYGAPSYDDGVSLGWEDPVYSKYLTLLYGEGESCTVTVSGYSLGLSNVLASYEVTEGEAEIADAADRAVWDYLCAILPPECRQKIARFDLFTDGYSNVLAYTAPLQREDGSADNTRFSIAVDYYDVYDENGAKRDWSKLTYTILHEYGHVLLEDETQVDLTVGETTHDPAGYVEGSFRRAFYDAFWAELDGSAAGEFQTSPTDFVSQYGANYFHEDIADTFAVFLLGGEPQGDTTAAEKLRFFGADGEMAALRETIRRNLGLEWPAE